MECGGCPLWAELSKSQHCSQVPDLALYGRQPEFEHLAVGWPASRRISAWLGQRQFSPAFRDGVLFSGARAGRNVLRARLFLCDFDRFAFEPRAMHLTIAETGRPITDATSGCADHRFSAQPIASASLA